MTQEEFYGECAKLLNIPHTYTKPVRRTRWTNRRLGNGRFPGFGLIRCYGATVIMTTREGTRQFSSFDAALTHLATR